MAALTVDFAGVSTLKLGLGMSAQRIVLTAEERAAIDALRSPTGRLVSPSFGPDWERAAA